MDVGRSRRKEGVRVRCKILRVVVMFPCFACGLFDGKRFVS
jgi:hypothetical protein